MNATAATTTRQHSNERLTRAASYASLSVAVFLIILKSAAWFFTGSVAVLSSLADSILDGIASLVTLFAIRKAQVPADREHRFGHGKAEPLAALAQSAFIIGSAVLLFYEAGNRFFHPLPVARPEIGIAVTVIAIVATLGLVTFQYWVVRRTNSIAINADSLHYKGDLLMNTAVIVALILSGWLDLPYADPVFALLIALYLAGNAWKIVTEAIDILMDRELPEEDRQKIIEIANSHPDARRAHDLRTRYDGQTSFIQLHLEMDANISLMAAHKIADDVEEMIGKAFPNSEIIIHQDPEGLEEDHGHFT